MAILGFLVHTLEDLSGQVEKEVGKMPEVTTYGVHEGCYVVAVAEAPSAGMEDLLARVREIDGVLTCYVTSMNTEDELLGGDGQV